MDMPLRDLERLTDNERLALSLLAAGHTVKSIAQRTGLSEASINERLREARRKTGIGSSRELARLLVQENRDMKIGMASSLQARAALPAEPVGDSTYGLKRKGYVLMTSIILGGAVAVALTFGSGPKTTEAPRDSSSTLTFLPEMQAPRQLHADLISETRDAAWATEIEVALEQRYARVDNTKPTHVICAATLCEVVGEIETEDESKANEAIKALQTGKLPEDITALGVTLTTVGFTKDRFYAFWKRNSG